MSENREHRRGSKYNRRNILRSAGAAGASMTLAGVLGTASAATSCQLPDQSQQDSLEDYEWERSNSDYYESSNTNPLTRLTEIQSGLVYLGSKFLEITGKWHHFFRSFGAGYTLQETYSEGEYEPTSSMSHQELKISNDNEDVASIFVSPNSKEVGAAPSPNNGDDLNYGSAAWTAATAALSGTSTFAAVAIPTVQAFAALLDNGESGSSSSVTYNWSYGTSDAPCESVHFAKYQFKSHEGSHHCNFTVRQEIGQYSGLWVMNEYDVFVKAAPYIRTASAESRPEPGTQEYIDFLERTNVATKVPADDLESPRVQELAGDGAVYRAQNPQIHITKRSGGGESAEN
ncbi:twin-arginine translocation signal domain-containing protein [Salinarchaeum sp. Harcht-Bsk1]|uniref:twin-arginine translocation signal domain-containing protein n=1 Tax=Salinarchaeum sp. Harcht-Bsk1 TaxID=1333523 RepID=UPI001181BD70|nr:twin-arginine translocation signal domain-containing protein [Salinarchaeum sp. Harcht-Bsk1]